MDGLVPVIIIGLILVFIALAVVGALQAKKRREAIRAWAMSHGLHFDRSKDYGLDERFGDFSFLRQGSDRYGFNRITGSWRGRELLGFDYHYATHSTDSKGRRRTHHHRFSAVILRARIPLQPLVIRAESFFDKVAGFFGYDDIDFESAEFSRRFHVKSRDRKWAYDVLHQRTIEFLLESPRFSIQFDRGFAAAWQSTRFTPGDFQAALGVIEGILDRMPRYLVDQQSQANQRTA